MTTSDNSRAGSASPIGARRAATVDVRGAGTGAPGRGRHPGWRQAVGQPQIPPDTPTRRLFIALSLPAAAIDEIGSFVNGMPTMARGNVRWIPRQNVHITLTFLGDTPEPYVSRIESQLVSAAAKSSAFTLKLGDPGAFPSFHSPKILWVGLTGEVRRLVQLQGRIEGSMRTLGFEPERRPFTPHISVGRTVRDLSRQYGGDIGFSWRRSILPPERTAVPVTEVSLMQSTLRPDGAIYETLSSAVLG